MTKDKRYWNKLAAYLSGELKASEKEDFLSGADARMKEDFILMEKTWKQFGQHPNKKYADSAKAWEKLNFRIESEGLDEIQYPVSRSIKMNYLLRVAAIIILVLSVGIPTVYYTAINGGNSTLEHHSKEGMLTVDLPDGSRVYLNEGSSLKYDKDFDDQRDVELDGEGFFDVMSDPKRPFKVSSGKVVVTVLGTSFNIRDLVNEQVEVFVESGRVELASVTSENKVILEPGDLALAGGEIKVAGLQDDNYLAWKTKEFKFVDTPVMEILHILENSYHVDVDIKDINISGLRLTTEYHNQSFDAILETICTALDLSYSKEDKVYILQSQ